MINRFLERKVYFQGKVYGEGKKFLLIHFVFLIIWWSSSSLSSCSSSSIIHIKHTPNRRRRWRRWRGWRRKQTKCKTHIRYLKRHDWLDTSRIRSLDYLFCLHPDSSHLLYLNYLILSKLFTLNISYTLPLIIIIIIFIIKMNLPLQKRNNYSVENQTFCINMIKFMLIQNEI